MSGWFIFLIIIAISMGAITICLSIDKLTFSIRELKKEIEYTSTHLEMRCKIRTDIPIEIAGPTAEWVIDHSDGNDGYYRCTNCNKKTDDPHEKYCPKCKCRMIF